MKYYFFEVHAIITTLGVTYHYYYEVPKMYDDSVSLDDIKEDSEVIGADYLEAALDQCPCIDVEGAHAEITGKNVTRKQYYNIITR